LAVFGCLLGVALWAQSDALLAGARFAAAGLPIWFVLWLLFKQIRRVAAEALETEELRQARAGGAGTAIFELDEESLLLEENRLRWMIRWVLPVVTILVAVYLLGGQFVGWRWTLAGAFGTAGVRSAEQPTLMMWLAVACCFLCFLFGRYTVALARLPQWHLLHAGAGLAAGTALVCLGLALALGLATTMSWAEALVAYAIRVAMFVLGLEFAVNLILDQYRPRAAGVVPRPAFDSRLAGLITEPGEIARSIAEAVNYQFGFEVSKTWFYRLLQRWFLPLVVLMLLAIFVLSSIVVVNAGEQAVVERFGRPWRAAEGVGSRVRLLSPGLHLKWPYPIDVVHRSPVEQIQEVTVGELEGDAAEAEKAQREKRPIVWAETHQFVPEMMVLVASPQLVELTEEVRGEPAEGERVAPEAAESVAVGLLMFGVKIHFRVRDLEAYLYNYQKPEKLLEEIAYQAVSDLAAQEDVDDVMGAGRARFDATLRERIQSRLDAHKCGLEVIFAGTGSLHPPAKEGVAEAFLSVISAETRMGANINAARGDAQRMLTEVAGTEERARRLDTAIERWQRLTSDASADADQAAQARRTVDALLLGDPAQGIAPMSGKAAALIADARARTSRQVADAAVKTLLFKAQVAAYNASRTLFEVRKQLEVFEGLDTVRKILFVGQVDDVIIEYDTGEQLGLDQILSEGVRERTGGK